MGFHEYRRQVFPERKVFKPSVPPGNFTFFPFISIVTGARLFYLRGRFMERRINYVLIGSLLAGFAACAILFFFDPSRVPIYPVCVFHQLTDLNCPGCGSLRAMHQLLHGHFAEAFQHNALLVISLPLLAWIGFRLVRQQVQKTTEPAVKPKWLLAYGIVWVLFGVLRELPIPVLSSLSP